MGRFNLLQSGRVTLYIIPLLHHLLATNALNIFPKELAASSSAELPVITPAPSPEPLLGFSKRNGTSPAHGVNGLNILQKRLTTEFETCFQDGDPTKIRTANAGFNCRVDVNNGLWGFCPQTVRAASDCGFFGVCIDVFSCTLGCGFAKDSKVKTQTCERTRSCETAILFADDDKPYSYVTCGGSPNGRVSYFLTTTTSKPKSSTQSLATSETLRPSRSDSSSSSSRSVTGLAAETATAGSAVGVPTESTSSANGGKDNTPLIAGTVIGGLAVICIAAVTGLYIFKRKRKNTPGTNPTETSSPPPGDGKTFGPYQSVSGGMTPFELSDGRNDSPRYEMPSEGLSPYTTSNLQYQQHSSPTELPARDYR